MKINLSQVPNLYVMRMVILYTFLITTAFSFSQEIPEIIPPSPNAASLGKYGQVPIGLFTGTPQIGIPIYTLKNKSLSVPISLNYSSNGIRVDEVASHVGLGWSLSAGGVITRTLRDDPDEGQRMMIPNEPFESSAMGYYLEAGASNDGVDTQPDLFSFNFNGFSGKFYLDETMTPTLLSPSPVKIEILTSLTYNDLNSPDPEIKITDPNGIIYFFGGGNASERSMNVSSNCGHSYPNLEVENSWYITKILNPLTGVEISFDYEKYNNTYNTGIFQSITNSMELNLSVGGTEDTCITRVNTEAAMLKEINSGSGKVQFSYSTGISGSYSKKLDSIKVLDVNNKQVKFYGLDYSVIDSDLSYLNDDFTILESDKKRLFLFKITEFDNNDNPNPPHIFEYINPEQMPPRFSYAQDYWGYFNGAINNTHLVNDLNYTNYFGSFNIVSDKSPNGLYGQKGMLKKITYPTGGYNVLTYEPNTYYGIKIIEPPLITMHLSVETDEDDFSDTDVKTINDVPFTHKAYINKNVMFNDYVNSCNDSFVTEEGELDYPWTIQAILIITDLTTNQHINFWQESFGQQDSNIGSSLTFSDNSPYSTIFVELLKDRSYQLELKVLKPCLFASVSINYHDQDIIQQYDNIEVGGIRIKSNTLYDNSSETTSKKYFYGSLNNPNQSSGVAELPQVDFQASVTFIEDNPGIQNNYTITSNTFNQLYSIENHHIVYEHVIESNGEDFQNGVVETTFKAVLPPLNINQNIGGTPPTNIFGTGKELLKNVFLKNGTSLDTINCKENIYFHDTILDKSLTVYNSRKIVFNSNGTVLGDPQYVYQFNVDEYIINSQWHYLKQTKEKQYNLNGTKPVTITTNYFYDNANHLQLSKMEVTNSKEGVLKTKYFYPQDKDQLQDLTTTASAAIDKLTDQNCLAELIQTEYYNEIGLLSTQRTNYSIESVGNNVIALKENIETAKGEITNTNPLEPRINYHDYDNHGNPVEVSKVNGPHIYYIWGYGKTKPIAKINNFDANDASTYSSQINYIVTKSNADDDTSHIFNQGDEGALRVALKNLQDALPSDKQMTFFTYDPLIGVTSVTDTKGDTQYYIYDNFNRLEKVVNKDNKILQEHEYHYKE